MASRQPPSDDAQRVARAAMDLFRRALDARGGDLRSLCDSFDDRVPGLSAWAAFRLGGVVRAVNVYVFTAAPDPRVELHLLLALPKTFAGGVALGPLLDQIAMEAEDADFLVEFSLGRDGVTCVAQVDLTAWTSLDIATGAISKTEWAGRAALRLIEVVGGASDALVRTCNDRWLRLRLNAPPGPTPTRQPGCVPRIGATTAKGQLVFPLPPFEVARGDAVSGEPSPQLGLPLFTQLRPVE